MEAYKAFVTIPSISALPQHNADSQRAAEWLADALREAGLENVAVNETGGNPIVCGDWLNAGADAPTVIVYGHYDVQPVDPLDLWESPPFTPIVKGNRIQGRGVADDKGQIMIHVAALDALTSVRGGAPINLKYVFEGEEESSSVHLDPWLEANRDRLAADLAVISDTGFFEGNRPAITVGLRGIAASGRRLGPRRRPPFGLVTAAPSRTRSTRWPPSGPLKGPTDGSGCPGSTTTSRRSPRPTGRRSRRSRWTRTPTSPRPAHPCFTANPTTRRSSAKAGGRRSR